MAEVTTIEWTTQRLPDGRVIPGATFNPWWGCVKISPACTYCYAADWAARFGTEWGKDARRRFFDDKHWNEPLSWDRKAKAEGVTRRVFCASMADVFEELPKAHPDRDAMDAARVRLWLLIEATPHLTWLLLTKRPEHMLAMTPDSWAGGWPTNVWAMTTVEDQKRADERIPHLVRVPAVVRGLSMEPLDGTVDLHLNQLEADAPRSGFVVPRRRDLLHWVIVGGESGLNARPSHPDHFRYLRGQCERSGVAYFMKQWGEWVPIDVTYSVEKWRSNLALKVNGKPTSHLQRFAFDDGQLMLKVGKKAAGRLLDGREWNESPTVTTERKSGHEGCESLDDDLPPLDIKGPSDWNAYDAYMAAGGCMDYEDWHNAQEAEDEGGEEASTDVS